MGQTAESQENSRRFAAAELVLVMCWAVAPSCTQYEEPKFTYGMLEETQRWA